MPDLVIAPEVATALQAVLPRMAQRTIDAIIAEVPAYADPFKGRMGQNIENAVQLSLGAFLRLVTTGEDAGSGISVSAALAGAYELGRGEARSGRSIDALLSAYRVGARISWRELSAAAVDAGLPAQPIAQFAEMVFAYIDELSASSVSGHSDELATAGRVRQRYLDRLTRQLLSGEDAGALRAGAETAAWVPPETLTAVLVPASQLHAVTTLLNAAVLQATDELPDLQTDDSWAVILVPDADGTRRSALLATLNARQAVVGPSRPWLFARASYLRAVRARHLLTGSAGIVDTDEHLVDLVLGADPDAGADLRRRVLAPLEALGKGTGDRLAETLRSWLLHQGRRDAVAAELFVHPQTVRYRMSQIRELFGERLTDPQTILELTVALNVASS